MKKLFKLGMTATFLAGSTAVLAWHGQAPMYPKTMKQDVVETVHGVEINDPYRWLENDIREDKNVANWVDAQNKVTHQYLNNLKMRDEIIATMTELWDYAKPGLPQKRGDTYFYRYNSGVQNQSPLYRQEGDGEREVLLDPNGWSEDGTLALAGYEPSPDGSHVLYAVQDGGSDWRTLQVVNAQTGEVLSDRVEWAKFTSLDWHPNGEGFFYARFPAPEEGAAMQSLNYNQTVYYHKIGTDQSEDQLIFARPDDKRISVGVSHVSEDGRYVFLSASNRAEGNGSEIWMLDTESADASPVALRTGFEHQHSIVGVVDDRLYVTTDHDAPNEKIVAISLDDPSQASVLIPEQESVISGADIVAGKLFVQYLEDVKSAVYRYSLSGILEEQVALPGIGSAFGFYGDVADDEVFYGFSSFNQPTAIYRYNPETGASETFMAPELAFDPADIVVNQVFYPSKDGTRVPMFVMHKKDLDMTKPHPTILYGYGGFNVSLTPSFSPSRLTWAQMGGVYAIANLRGGGEYGKKWHDAGRLENKQNVFDDFIAAGEFLIKEGLTSTDHLAIAGGSNGGLLVGAVINQRPDMFAAALPAVGVMDMLRFHKFTAGRFWVYDYGNPDTEKDFNYLLTYSPYHNIKPNTDYPPTLITTADRDDRVVPGHSFKYAARMQEYQFGASPRLIRIESRAGHGSGMPTSKRIEAASDQLAFVAHNAGMEK